MNGKGVDVQARRFASFVRKIRLTDNTVILFKEGSVEHDALNRLADIISKAGIKNVILMTVKDVNEVSALSEKEMAKHGWVRALSVARAIFERKNNGSKDGEQNSSARDESQLS